MIAALMVTNLSASSGETRPSEYLTALAASRFMRRASSSESELKLVSSPASWLIGPACGIASCTSTLYAHQSEKRDAPSACSRTVSATL